MTDLPDIISDEEVLGRAVFDGRKARRAARDGTISPKTFREKDGVRELSVDRLSFGNHLGIAQSHDDQREQQCLGWATVSALVARGNGRTVLADPIIPTNVFHAIVLLPELGEDALETQQEHALELATVAKWLERPTVP